MKIGSKEYDEWLNNPLTKALKKSFEKSVTDPENQPSQYGTVTLEMYEALEAVLREAREALQKSTPLKRYDDDDYFERSWEVHKQAIDRIDEVLGEKK